MLDSESASVGFTDSSFPRSHGSECATSVPIIQISSYEHDQSRNQGKAKVLPQLPSHKLQYTVWHELKSTQVTGDQLNAPRIREGPESKNESFYSLTDENGSLIHHSKVGKELIVYRDQQENWEKAIKVNLSHQLLSQSYQKNNFMRILERLKSAEVINLSDNWLHDLSSLSFLRCTEIILNNNHFSSFQKLPKMPNLRHLKLTHNQIRGTNGLARYPNLEVLEIKGNGLTYTKHYRNRVFEILPKLKVLDGTLKHPSDMEPMLAKTEEGKGCSLM